MSTLMKFRLRSLFVGVGIAMLVAAVVGGGFQLVGTVIERSSSAAPVDDAAYEFQQLRPDTKQMNPCPSGLRSSGVCCSGA